MRIKQRNKDTSLIRQCRANFIERVFSSLSLSPAYCNEPYSTTFGKIDFSIHHDCTLEHFSSSTEDIFLFYPFSLTERSQQTRNYVYCIVKLAGQAGLAVS